MKLSNKAIVIGKGTQCPKCKELMERRSHPGHYIHRKSYFYTEWDFCSKCKHIQHYEEFKSTAWKQEESQMSFLKSL